MAVETRTPTSENYRINSHGLEFKRQARKVTEVENSFPFYTKDGRYWVVGGKEAFLNGHNRIPSGFNMDELLLNLRSHERRLFTNPDEKPHNGVVDLIWKNWTKLWEHFQPDTPNDVEPVCFREVFLPMPNLDLLTEEKERNGQPDLVGIGPNGTINIIEVGALGSSSSRRLKRRRVEKYEESFRRIFGEDLATQSFVIFYRRFKKGYLASFESPRVLENGD